MWPTYLLTDCSLVVYICNMFGRWLHFQDICLIHLNKWYDSAECLFRTSWKFAVMHAVDERTHIRDLGLRRILKAKNEICNKARTPVRCFKVPILNFNATDYVHLLNWKSSLFHQFYWTCLKNNSKVVLPVIVYTNREFWKFSMACHTQCWKMC